MISARRLNHTWKEAGVGEARRDAILGHSKKGMDAHYLFVSDESLRQGMDQYTAWLDEQIDAHVAKC